MTAFCCMCELQETAWSLDDGTHAVEARPKWACEHGLRTGVVSDVGGWKAWPVDRCSIKDAGKSESKTFTRCATESKRKKEKEKERERGLKRSRKCFVPYHSKQVGRSSRLR